MIQSLGDIAVTGVGVALPLGLNAETIVERVRRSDSAIGRLTRFDYDGSAAEVPTFELRSLLRKPKNEKFMSESVRFAMLAAHQAVDRSGLDFNALEPERIAIHTGSGQTGICYDALLPAAQVAWKGVEDRDWSQMGGRASKLIDAYFSMRTLSNSGVGLLAAEHGARGPGCNFVHGETSGGWALHAAAADLTEDRCDAAIVGAYDGLLVKAIVAGYGKSGFLSASGRLAPFAEDRDGLVLGEGSAFFVLERKEDAQARGAAPLAILKSFVSASQMGSDGLYPGATQALAASLSSAALAAERPFDLVVARGVGTPSHDAEEAALLCRLQGAGARVAAFKGLTGYLGAASLAAEIALSIFCVRAGLLPGCFHLGRPDKTLGFRPLREGVPFRGERCEALALASGWSGSAAAIAYQIPAATTGSEA